MTVWRAHPWELAADLTQRLGIEVKAARDGMSRRGMSPQQRFLLLLILVGALATVLGLVSKRARLLPYPVVLAAAGIGRRPPAGRTASRVSALT